MRSIWHSLLWLVGVVVVVASGCQTPTDASGSRPERPATNAPVIAHNRWLYHFTGLRELVHTADAVVVGRSAGSPAKGGGLSQAQMESRSRTACYL